MREISAFKMASCFRTVSSKLCCSNFFKPTCTVRFETSVVNLRKPVRLTPSKYDIKASDIGKVYRNSPSSHLCCFNNHVNGNTDIVFDPRITSYDFVTDYHANELNSVTPSFFIFDCSSVKSSSTNSQSDKQSSTAHGLPSDEQLSFVHDELSKFLPRLFKPSSFNPELYNKNIILENRIRGTRHVGLNKYVSQLGLLKMIVHFKFAYVRFDVLKITKHPEDGSVKCRWRISGVHGMDVIFQFWKFSPSNMKSVVDDAPTWYDGFSTYYVGADGTICKHVIDKMMPDNDKVVTAKSLGSRVALCLGVFSPEQQELLNDLLLFHEPVGSFVTHTVSTRKNVESALIR